MAVLGLIVFLFFVRAHGRRDPRLWLWTAGWLSIVAHFAVELWSPASAGWQNVQACISVDALLLAASCFIYSQATKRLPARTTRTVAATLIPATLLTLNLAVIGWPTGWVLALLVAGRQALAIVWIRSSRRALQFTGSSIFMALLIGVWMCTSVLQGHPEIVVYGLLCEVYLSAALNFYAYGWRSSIAVRTMIAGFVAWAAVFPVAYFVSVLWPHFTADPEIWNVPKFFVAIGMILAVMEEDTQVARDLGNDYRLLFDSNPQPFWILEVESLRFLAVNQAALDAHGYTREEFLQLTIKELLEPESRGVAIENVRTGKGRQHRASRHLRKDGSTFPMDITVQDITFQGKRCRFVMAVDVTEREVLQRELDHKAVHDQLTGLPNRALLSEMLEQAVRRTKESREKIAVISLDIDRFKRINDEYGLRIGDACIRRVAEALVVQMRAMDVVARTGGDEFTIVLTGLKTTLTAEWAVRDLIKMFAEPQIVEGYEIQIPVNVGVAIGPDDGDDAQVLWRGAERAREQAKASAPGTAVWFSAELRKAADEQTQIETYLRASMDDGSLSLAYQPLYGADGRVESVEALLRLNHPTLGLVSPDKLIPIAETAGLMISLGEWVIESACHQLLMWKARQVPLVPVAVNVSGLQIMHSDFARRLMVTLERHGIDPGLIHVEVTESVAMRNVEAVSAQMELLANQGISFSIDDFGTGYSSLGRLSELRASVLKIDRSFMQPDCSKHAHSIVQAIITMAHSLGHKVVAEGVESETQLGCLRGLGCDLYQGYLLARPLPADEIPALIGVVHPVFSRAAQEASEGLHLVASSGA